MAKEIGSIVYYIDGNGWCRKTKVTGYRMIHEVLGNKTPTDNEYYILKGRSSTDWMHSSRIFDTPGDACLSLVGQCIDNTGVY